jgi:hypothetical protein
MQDPDPDPVLIIADLQYFIFIKTYGYETEQEVTEIN